MGVKCSQQLLTPKQVAERLQVSEDTVRGWCGCGDLLAVNVSKGHYKERWRITEDDLTEFLSRKRT